MDEKFVVRGFYEDEVFVVKQNTEQNLTVSEDGILYFDESRVSLIDGNYYLDHLHWQNSNQNVNFVNISNNVEGYEKVQGEIVLSIHDYSEHTGPTELTQSQKIPLRKNNFYNFTIFVATHRSKAAVVIQLLDKNQIVLREIEKNVPADIAGGKHLSSYMLVREQFRVRETEHYFRLKLRKESTIYGDDSFMFVVLPSLNILRSNGSLKTFKVPTSFQQMLFEAIEINSTLIVVKSKASDIDQLGINILPNNVFGTFNADKKMGGDEQILASVPITSFKPSDFHLNRHLPAFKDLKVVIGTVLYNNTQHELSNLSYQSNRSVAYAKREFGLRNINIVFEFIFIDNSSSKLTVPETMRDWISFENWTNTGFAAGHNLLMSRSFDETLSADYYIMVNPDGYPLEDCYYNMINAAHYYSDVGLVEASQFPIDHPKNYDPITLETPWCSGACLLVSKAAYESTMGFDEKFVMYCEDVDLSWRVRDAGLKILYIPRAAFFHDVRDRSSKQTRKSMLVSGRYLAHKWGAPDFLNWVEEMLVAEGHFPAREYLPSLSEQMIKRVPDLCEFRQGFYFSLPRW